MQVWQDYGPYLWRTHIQMARPWFWVRPHMDEGPELRHRLERRRGQRRSLFIGTKAYGVHKGAVDVIGDNGVDTGIDDAIHMAVNYFSHLPIEVLTD